MIMKKFKLLKKKSILRKKKTKKDNKNVSKNGNKKIHIKSRIQNSKQSRIQNGGDRESLTISYNENSIGNDTNITDFVDYRKAPKITINNSDMNKTYLITMTDPDAPNGEDRKSKNFTFTHWIFTMINGQINDIFVSYYPPSPPKGSGIHRYQFNLYDISTIDTDGLKVNNNNADYYKTTLQPFLDKNNNKNIAILPITSFQYKVKAANV